MLKPYRWKNKSVFFADITKIQYDEEGWRACKVVGYAQTPHGLLKGPYKPWCDYVNLHWREDWMYEITWLEALLATGMSKRFVQELYDKTI